MLKIPSYSISTLFDFDEEGTVTTWFSSSLWAMAATFAYLCSQELSKINPAESKFWKVFSLFLMLCSLDEVARLHERIGDILSFKVFHLEKEEWVPFLAPVIIFVIITFILKLRRYLINHKDVLRNIIFGMLLVFWGAVVIEYIGFILKVKKYPKWMYATEVIFEESLEMIGVITLLYGISLYHRYLRFERA